MAFIIDQLGLSNPFATPIGQLIEKATDAEQATENWSLLLEICDIINETEEGPKDAMRAIRKRLQQAAGKSTQTTMFTLTVVETCVKNCGHRFHILVATKDFMQDLVKLIGPKNDPPQVLQERVLSLIQTWADAFATSPDLREVARTYQELKTKGVEFPMTDLDNLAPIHTPARSFPDADSEHHHAPAARPTSSQPPSQVPSVHHSRQHVAHAQPQQPQHVHTHYPPPVTDVRPPGSLSTEQMAKLRRDLDIVYQNCFVFNDMLTELKPGHESADELVLLQELNTTCHQMQARIMELVQQVQNEDITGELLRVNDDLLNAFVRYDRFERQRKSQGGGATPDDDEQFAGPPPSYEHSATLPLHSRPVPAPAAAAVGNLIDFDAPTSNDHPNTNNVNSVGMANLSLADPRPTGQGSGFDDDFDMFAHSRQSFDQNQKQLSSGAAYRNQQEDRHTGGLGAAINAKVTPGSDTTKKSSDRASSAEFDEFLSERARGLGDGNRAYAVENTSSQQAGRQLTDSDHDNSLFAL